MIVPRSKWRNAQNERRRLSDQVHALKRDLARMEEDAARVHGLKVRCSGSRCLRVVNLAEVMIAGVCSRCAVVRESAIRL